MKFFRKSTGGEGYTITTTDMLLLWSLISLLIFPIRVVTSLHIINPQRRSILKRSMSMASSSSEQQQPNREGGGGRRQPKEIIIVGAGAAGIACARDLLTKNGNQQDSINVTILEASNDIGGRIKGQNNFVPGHILDLGAEFVHCRGHVLWEWIDSYIGKTTFDKERETVIMKEQEQEDGPPTKFESIFLLSHADGGPQEEPTIAEGKYLSLIHI